MKYQDETNEKFEVDIVEYVDIEPLETSAVGIGAYPNAVAEATVPDEQEVTKEKVTAFERKRKELGMSVEEFYAAPRDPPSASALPIFDAAHVRNAMARFNQTHFRSREEKIRAYRKILRAAKKFGIDVRNFEKLNPEKSEKSYGGEKMAEEVVKEEQAPQETTETPVEEKPQEEAKVEEKPAEEEKKEETPAEEEKEEPVEEEKKEEQLAEPEKSVDTADLLKQIEALKKELEELKTKKVSEIREEIVKEVEKDINVEPKGLVETEENVEKDEETDVNKTREELIKELANDPEFLKFFSPNP